MLLTQIYFWNMIDLRVIEGAILRSKLFKWRSRLDIIKYVFGNRVTDKWNTLPQCRINCTSLNNFKSHMHGTGNWVKSYNLDSERYIVKTCQCYIDDFGEFGEIKWWQCTCSLPSDWWAVYFTDVLLWLMSVSKKKLSCRRERTHLLSLYRMVWIDRQRIISFYHNPRTWQTDRKSTATAYTKIDVELFHTELMAFDLLDFGKGSLVWKKEGTVLTELLLKRLGLSSWFD